MWKTWNVQGGYRGPYPCLHAPRAGSSLVSTTVAHAAVTTGTQGPKQASRASFGPKDQPPNIPNQNLGMLFACEQARFGLYTFSEEP